MPFLCQLICGSILFFLSGIYCKFLKKISLGKYKASASKYIKLFKEGLANMRSFPDINLVVAFITFFFFTPKDLMLADPPSLNSMIIFVLAIYYLFFNRLKFSFVDFFIFLKYLQHQGLLPFCVQSIFFLPSRYGPPY